MCLAGTSRVGYMMLHTTCHLHYTKKNIFGIHYCVWQTHLLALCLKSCSLHLRLPATRALCTKRTNITDGFRFRSHVVTGVVLPLCTCHKCQGTGYYCDKIRQNPERSLQDVSKAIPRGGKKLDRQRTCKRNIEKCSRNHCQSGKAISIIHSEGVLRLICPACKAHAP